MADVGSVGKGAAGLAKISDDVKAIHERLKKAKAQQTSQPQRAFEKYTNDVGYDNRIRARDIGNLIRNTSRLSVFSSLTKGDSADHFRFRVTNSGEARVGRLDPANARFELMTRTGIVVADSGADKDSKAGKNYEKLEFGELRLDPGQYVIRMTRNKGVPASQEVNYGVQLQMGSFVDDYDTIEQVAKPGTDFALPAATNTLSDMMGMGYNFLEGLGKIGLTGTQKLMRMFASVGSLFR